MECPICGRPYLRVNSKRVLVTHASGCELTAVDDRRLKRLALKGVEPPERPEFPTYVGADGREHGEY